MRLDTPIKKVRKARRCQWCGEMINAGEPAMKVVGVGDDFFYATLHPECHEVEAKWWQLPWRPEYWPEERMKRGTLTHYEP